ncbi:hypothetical protein Krac_1622 [Ktedonobacter racemifer DSM 44963]|uniref:Uncharacterized protein n=1 Tax=Ktedonobacter racemifer DSM 44963 TaxID=485913 RepID=D6U2L1_KTERA|nr:hypothetical protein Krac_1622 [Ktedonobacter racemifer DSM 44963]
MRLIEQSELLLLKEHVLLEFRLFQVLLLGITRLDSVAKNFERRKWSRQLQHKNHYCRENSHILRLLLVRCAHMYFNLLGFNFLQHYLSGDKEEKLKRSRSISHCMNLRHRDWQGAPPSRPAELRFLVQFLPSSPGRACALE